MCETEFQQLSCDKSFFKVCFETEQKDSQCVLQSRTRQGLTGTLNFTALN